MTFVFSGHRLRIETEYERITQIGKSTHIESTPKNVSLDANVLTEDQAISLIKEYFAEMRNAGVA